MRCKKCTKPIKTPSKKMRKTQICSECSKKSLQQTVKDASKNTQKNNVNKPKIIKPKKESIKDLKNEQIENYNKLIQITNEIRVQRRQMKTFKKYIKLEKEELKKGGKTDSEFIKKISTKNKSLTKYSTMSPSDKSSKLEKDRSELVKKYFKKYIYRTRGSEILEKIQANQRSDKSKKDKRGLQTSSNSQDSQKAHNIKNSPLIDQTKLPNNGLCKKICNTNKVKIIPGRGRYSSGQVHCQTCDVWLDHNGCHKRNGSPAERDTIGMRCNCCNFQVRTKPRGKLYKKKLADKLTIKNLEFNVRNPNPCIVCGLIPTVENIEYLFGFTMSNGKTIRQVRCRKCRHSTSTNSRR